MPNSKYAITILIFVVMLCPTGVLASEVSAAGDLSDLREQEAALGTRYVEALGNADSRAQDVRNALDELRRKLGQNNPTDSDTLPVGQAPGSADVSEQPQSARAVQAVPAVSDSDPKTPSAIKASIQEFVSKSSSADALGTLLHRAKDLLDNEKFSEAIAPLKSAVEEARNRNDAEAVEEAGANLVYALYRSGDTDGAMEALREHENDRIPALEKRIEKSLAGTTFDPAFRNMVSDAKSLWKQEMQQSSVWGKKPGFLSHFNPFYQVSRIKAYASQKSFHKKIDTLLNRAWSDLDSARQGGSEKAVSQAETNFQALSMISTDFSENPDTRISDDQVELFDPANLFASSDKGLYLNVDEAFEGIPNSVDLPAEDNLAQTQLLNVNSEAWHARWYMLSSARRKIDTTYFIIDPDIFGSAFIGLLLQKAREGVQIRLMMDDRGVKKYTKAFKGVDYIQELMTFSNVQVKTFNPIKKNIPRIFLGVSKIMASNHDKIIVIDDELCMTGGRNVAAHYFADPEDCDDIFRDTDVMMRSRGVAKQLTIAFDEEFARMRNVSIKKDFLVNLKERATELDISRTVVDLFQQGVELDAIRERLLLAWPDHSEAIEQRVDEMARYPATGKFADFRPLPENRKMAVRILDKHSTNDTRNDITRGLIAFMDSAKDEIIIENPYVVLSKRARAALVRASRRGVKISIITNNPESSNDGYTDMALTQSMFLLDWMKLKRDAPNVRIYAMKGPNRLHAKVFVFDRRISVIGTYNLDPMSEQINSEVVACVSDEFFAESTAGAIEEDIKAKGLEYTIQIGKDGIIREKTGPSDYFDAKVLKKLKLMGNLKLIRPLI